MILFLFLYEFSFFATFIFFLTRATFIYWLSSSDPLPLLACAKSLLATQPMVSFIFLREWLNHDASGVEDAA